jgi:hypothetical protein
VEGARDGRRRRAFSSRISPLVEFSIWRQWCPVGGPQWPPLPRPRSRAKRRRTTRAFLDFPPQPRATNCHTCSCSLSISPPSLVLAGQQPDQILILGPGHGRRLVVGGARPRR